MRTIMILVILGVKLTTSVYAQAIDESIARELGLVKSPAAGAPTTSSTTRQIDLNVGQMREIVFPEQGTLTLKRKDAEKIEYLNVNNSLYITPKQSLDEETVGIFVLSQSKRSFVLNFKTTTASLNGEAVIVGQPIANTIIEQGSPQIKRLPVPGNASRSSRRGGYEYDQYVELTAFASRSAYASERVINAPRGIAQVQLPRKIKRLKTLMRDQRIAVKPLSSWQRKGVFVTVIELKNTGDERIELRPELVRGGFVAKAFEHNELGTNETNQYTALYLVSLNPFEQSIWE